jgi:hypothetical protein
MPVSQMGYLYMIESFDQGVAKIGHGLDPVRRRHQLQTGNPAKLVLVGAVPAPYSVEAEFHATIADLRVGLEWYRDLELLRGLFCDFDQDLADAYFEGRAEVVTLDHVRLVPDRIARYRAFCAEHGLDDPPEPIETLSLQWGEMWPLPASEAVKPWRS